MDNFKDFPLLQQNSKGISLLLFLLLLFLIIDLREWTYLFERIFDVVKKEFPRGRTFSKYFISHMNITRLLLGLFALRAEIYIFNLIRR